MALYLSETLIFLNSVLEFYSKIEKKQSKNQLRKYKTC